jgi:spore coat protein A
MYHCHILEHEDRDMMRPVVTMAPQLMPFMA